MKDCIPLTDLKMNMTAKICFLNCSDHIKRRFLDLGIIPDTPITPIFKSIPGDPIAYEVRGSLLAIREKDSKNIFVCVT